jgi:hypothetical protein
VANRKPPKKAAKQKSKKPARTKGGAPTVAPERKPVGRPSLFTQEIADRICAELAEGRSLRSVCLADDLPDARTIFRWLRTNEDFCQQYARAKQESADAMAEEILDIADDGTNDWMERKNAEGTVIGYVENGEALQRSRLRVDTRKWLASKLKPKRYGDKLELGGEVGGTFRLVNMTGVKIGGGEEAG